MFCTLDEVSARFVVPNRVSRMNTSAKTFVSHNTRLSAIETNPTKRPFLESEFEK